MYITLDRAHHNRHHVQLTLWDWTPSGLKQKFQMECLSRDIAIQEACDLANHHNIALCDIHINL